MGKYSGTLLRISCKIYIIVFLLKSCRTCISGEQYSTAPHQRDGRSHKYRATDILMSLGGSGAEINNVLTTSNIDFELYNKPF